MIPQSCPAGTTDLGDGTCQEPARTVVGAAPIVIPQACPAGTTDLGDGTCQEPAKTVIGAAPIVVPQPCPAGATDLGNGTCEAPSVVIQQAPQVIAPTCPTGTFFSQGSCIASQPAPTSGEYCYGNGKSLYDSKGRKIKGSKARGKLSCQGH